MRERGRERMNALCLETMKFNSKTIVSLKNGCTVHVALHHSSTSHILRLSCSTKRMVVSAPELQQQPHQNDLHGKLFVDV